jgi:transcriptional regulator with PAS, ATPase and Fis domain
VFWSDTAMSIQYDTTVLSQNLDTLFAPVLTMEVDSVLTAHADTVSTMDSVQQGLDTVVTTTVTEYESDTLRIYTDSLSDGVVFRSDTAVSILYDTTQLSETRDTLFAPVLTEEVDSVLVAHADTVSTMDSVQQGLDTVVTTTVTEYESDTLRIYTDSLSDGVVFWSDTAMNILYDTTVLSQNLDTLFAPVLTMEVDSVLTAHADTVTTVDSTLQGADTVVTTTVTEYESDTLRIYTDSLSDGVVFWSDTAMNILYDTTQLSETRDTLFAPVLTEEVDSVLVAHADTVTTVDSLQQGLDTVVTTTVTEYESDTLRIYTDSLSDGVVFWSDTAVSILYDTTQLSETRDTLFAPVLTEEVDSVLVAHADTVTTVDSTMQSADTVVTTTVTEYESDTLRIYTDSLSDGVVFRSDTAMSILYDTAVLSQTLDTLFAPAVPVLSENVDSVLIAYADTVTTMDSVQQGLDTVVTTTVTEYVSDTLRIHTDSLSDGVVFWSDTAMSILYDTTQLSETRDTLFAPVLTEEVDSVLVAHADTVSTMDSVQQGLDTVVTTTVTEYESDTLRIYTDSLSDGVVFRSDTAVSILYDTTQLSETRDTLFAPVLTEEVDSVLVAHADTVSTMDSVQQGLDTVVTTTVTEYESDTLRIYTDSLSDGVVFRSDTAVSILYDTTQLSETRDTLFAPVLTEEVDSVLVAHADTVSTVDSLQQGADTVVTTTVTEYESDTLRIYTDSLSDGVVFWSDTVMSILYDTNVISIMQDTLYMSVQNFFVQGEVQILELNSSLIFIEYEFDLTADLIVELTNLQGKKIEVICEFNRNTLALSPESPLKSGIYFLSVFQNREQRVKIPVRVLQ